MANSIARATSSSGLVNPKFDEHSGEDWSLSAIARRSSRRVLRFLGSMPLLGKMHRIGDQKLLFEIGRQEPQIAKLNDEELVTLVRALRFRAKSGESVEELAPEAFAIAREACRRATGLRPYDVQLLGGLAMARGAIAEMQTGEGKTLTAIMPLFVHALFGKGCHLATVNDYLAERDAEFARPVFELLGMSVGVISSEKSPDERTAAYQCDVTYGVANEIGFDFLRDRLSLREKTARFAARTEQSPTVLQRSPWYVLIDEADSILLDEASTPLVIGVVDETDQEASQALLRWGALHAEEYVESEHYDYDHRDKTVSLTLAGRRQVRRSPKTAIINDIGLFELYEAVERAIKVSRDFHLGHQYVVREGEICIVDEFTGRISEGRKWQRGVHQAIEAKEQIEITAETGKAAQITIQDLFRRYATFGGMTGTASTSASELKKVYKKLVEPIPTHRASQRVEWEPRVFATASEKWDAIVSEVAELHRTGRPVLIGTRSIDQSEAISIRLTASGIIHRTLNANQSAEEADIVAEAGRRRRVTVATNMAGRGTDIKLEAGVAELGGLHVIGSEMHESARVDRQLIGRCGRQGDAGSFRLMLSLEDELLREGLKKAAYDKLRTSTQSLPALDVFKKAQRRVEKERLTRRMMLLHESKQRKSMQQRLGLDPYLDSPE